jgi:hypothetical protein
MNTITCDPYLIWKDVDGPMGLLLDGAFCSFVILAALSMLPFALLILLADHAVSPVESFLSKLLAHRPA